MGNSQFGDLTATAVEKHVREIWVDVLAPADGQDDATFFELQGQSISAVRITARIEDELGIAVDIGELFGDPDLDTFVRGVVAQFEADSAQRRRPDPVTASTQPAGLPGPGSA